jgi:hypothetical protein
MNVILCPTNPILKRCTTRNCHFFIAGHGKNACDSHFSQIRQRLLDFSRKNPDKLILSTDDLVDALNEILNHNTIRDGQVQKPKATTLVQKLVIPPIPDKRAKLKLEKFKNNHFFQAKGDITTTKSVSISRLSPLLQNMKVSKSTGKEATTLPPKKPMKQGAKDQELDEKTGRPQRRRKVGFSPI